ncbi:MAG TPA: flagellar biosynthesis anti-sigma factor FlgM [Polyangia bacterium]
MSDTNRTIGPRRPPLAARQSPLHADMLVNAPSRVDALRRLVAAGQYQVSPRWLATKIFRAAGVTIPG